jgi:hypothetical protein
MDEDSIRRGRLRADDVVFNALGISVASVRLILIYIMAAKSRHPIRTLANR